MNAEIEANDKSSNRNEEKEVISIRNTDNDRSIDFDNQNTELNEGSQSPSEKQYINTVLYNSNSYNSDLNEYKNDIANDSLSISPSDHFKQIFEVYNNNTINSNTNSVDNIDNINIDDEIDKPIVNPQFIQFIDKLDINLLVKIDINGSKSGFRLIDQDIKLFVDSAVISHLPLESISFTNHRITGIHITIFDKQILTITLDVGMEHIGRLTTNTKYCYITYLNMQGNDITNIDSIRLNSNSRCNIITLNLSYNPLSNEGVESLANSLIKNKKLIHLYLNNCNINLTNIILILTNLYNNKRLEILEINRILINNITYKEEHIDHLSRLLLDKHINLSNLSLKYNNITNYGAKLLSDVLIHNYKIIELNLECNNIAVNGAESLASYIIYQYRYKNNIYVPNNNKYKYVDKSDLNYLQVLKLSFNFVCNEGATALAEAISMSEDLHTLTLMNNNISSEGLIALCKSIKQSNSIKSITLFGNNFDQTSGGHYYDLVHNYLPKTDIYIDINVYVVDDIYYIAKA